MSATTSADVPAFNFTFDPSASHYVITKAAYVSLHAPAGYGLIATGALVFDSLTSSSPRVLLVQRSACDTMPHKWEVPGGACDDEDTTILHAVARELWEEAGLKATHIREAAGNPHVFITGSGKPICKNNFVVEVEKTGEGALQPKLDPQEHQQYVWANEVEVKARKVGDIELNFTSEQMQDTLLQTFEQLCQERKSNET